MDSIRKIFILSANKSTATISAFPSLLTGLSSKRLWVPIKNSTSFGSSVFSENVIVRDTEIHYYELMIAMFLKDKQCRG